MGKSLGSFRAALLIGWIALGVGGLVYARAKDIPGWAALPALAAILIEYPFYLVAGLPAVRERLAGPRLPAFLVASAVLPYLVCCLGAVPFQWIGLIRLTALALALSLWYIVLPAMPIVDVAFLAVVPAVLLGGFFDPIYPTPYKGVQVAILGHLALIQIAVMVLILERRVHETGYGFIPNGREWRIGALHFLYFAVLGLPLALLLKATHFNTPAPVWRIAGTFVAMLWVVALSEEFFFRGVLQRWIEEWTWNPSLALLLASLVFGAVHLWFRGFPNWRWALVAAVLGWFCGRARNQAGSIRAAMVTHALAITTWRAFFA